MTPSHYRQFSVAVAIHGKLAAEWMTEILRSRQRTLDFNWSIDDGVLHLTDRGDDGNVELVATFLRELVNLGYVVEPVAIYWADRGSRHGPDGFMGGAALVTKRRTYWFVLPEIVERNLQQLRRRET